MRTTLTARFRSLTMAKFSFAKSSDYARLFANECGANSMYDSGFGLGIPSNWSGENQLRGVFNQIISQNGVFFFNINGVDLKRAKRGFNNYNEAESNNQITEWELHIIMTNPDYLKNCIFHNGKVVFKKRVLWKAIK